MLAPTHPSYRASLEQVEAHVRRAVEAALTYFGQQNSDFPVNVMAGANMDSKAAADCTPDIMYLNAMIHYDAEFFQSNPESIWRILGHEVAHIVTRELIGNKHHFVKENGSAEDDLFMRGIENATVRLERMFTRDCPDPGWDK